MDEERHGGLDREPVHPVGRRVFSRRGPVVRAELPAVEGHCFGTEVEKLKDTGRKVEGEDLNVLWSRVESRSQQSYPQSADKQSTELPWTMRPEFFPKEVLSNLVA